MTNEANTIIDTIRASGAETDQEVVAALEDGETLAALGITDADTEAVEVAHAELVARARSTAG